MKKEKRALLAEKARKYHESSEDRKIRSLLDKAQKESKKNKS